MYGNGHGMGAWGWLAMSLTTLIVWTLIVAATVLVVRASGGTVRAGARRRPRRTRPSARGPSGSSVNGSPEARTTTRSTSGGSRCCGAVPLDPPRLTEEATDEERSGRYDLGEVHGRSRSGPIRRGAAWTSANPA